MNSIMSLAGQKRVRSFMCTYIGISLYDLCVFNVCVCLFCKASENTAVRRYIKINYYYYLLQFLYYLTVYCTQKYSATSSTHHHGEKNKNATLFKKKYYMHAFVYCTRDVRVVESFLLFCFALRSLSFYFWHCMDDVVLLHATMCWRAVINQIRC